MSIKELLRLCGAVRVVYVLLTSAGQESVSFKKCFLCILLEFHILVIYCFICSLYILYFVGIFCDAIKITTFTIKCLF